MCFTLWTVLLLIMNRINYHFHKVSGYIIFGLFIMLVFIKPIHAAEEKVYKVGIVPQFNSRKIFSIWRPILNELELKTGLKFKLVGSADIPTFEKEYLNGNFDIAYTNPYFMMLGIKRSTYVPLIHDMARQLQGIIVVRKDSPVKNVRELNGTTVAFPSPNAVGASLVTRSDFKYRLNIKIIPKYVKTHTSVYLHVFKGLTAAGGGVINTLSKQDSVLKNNLKIIHRTRPFATHAIAANRRIDIIKSRLITESLIEISKSERGKLLFNQIPITQAGEAHITDYSVLDSWKLEEFVVNND